MSKIELAKTQVPDNYVQALNTQGYLFNASYAHMIAWISFAAVGDILREIKSKDKPAAFVFKNNVNEFVVGAVVKYIPSEDPEHPEGNWSYVWTFDESDITPDMIIADITNQQNHGAFVTRAAEKWHIDYYPGSIPTVHTTFFTVLKEWLSINAKADEEMEVSLLGVEGVDVFLARSMVEDGETIMSIEPVGKMVQLIKDDKALQEENK